MKRLIQCINWTVVAAIAAVVSAIFAGLAWHNSEKALNYTKAKEAPDLWMKKDVFVLGKYKITQLSHWNQPNGIPAKSVVLQHFPIEETETGYKVNRICNIVNASSKSSSNTRIDNYTGLFGELHFENRGTVPIKEIEMTSYRFKMKEDTKYTLEDFELTPIGKLNVDIERGSPLILYIGYLFDNDEHMLCDPQYMSNDGLRLDAVQKKKMQDDQLRCYLDVIIDLYDEMSFTLRYTAQDGSTYDQEYTISINRFGEGGIYNPNEKEAVRVKK